MKYSGLPPYVPQVRPLAFVLGVFSSEWPQGWFPVSRFTSEGSQIQRARLADELQVSAASLLCCPIDPGHADTMWAVVVNPVQP